MEQERREDETRELPAADYTKPRPSRDESGRRSPGGGSVEQHVMYRTSSSWNPAQVVALAAGIFLLVLGGIAVARGGLGDLLGHVQVGGFHHTALFGLIEMALGLMLMAMGAIPGPERGGMVFTGGLLLAFGIILAVQGESLHGVLGTHGNNGWVFIIIGIAVLIAALVAPVFEREDEVIRR